MDQDIYVTLLWHARVVILKNTRTALSNPLADLQLQAGILRIFLRPWKRSCAGGSPSVGAWRQFVESARKDWSLESGERNRWGAKVWWRCFKVDELNGNAVTSTGRTYRARCARFLGFNSRCPRMYYPISTDVDKTPITLTSWVYQESTCLGLEISKLAIPYMSLQLKGANLFDVLVSHRRLLRSIQPP
ncbi:hypothetical protein CYLTODRAFT_415110 [Cylindrobasidium torrendii FP15055 ss-10]|uniref:Uncharacterized protein n=1 Tax=Cylindrobasidium torrendii FP15055 ss-10 TaxID=1314674 RepID=A0A0D7AU55_9AGAR|nr:hypothetical protein CYLTODRAFT_415110 [Cylindrobasidium torrendii FP15055 ss-10]